MSIPASWHRKAAWVLAAAGLLLVFGAGAALASGGEGGPKGWVTTDTYRVMNFVVLAFGVFYLLRKPVSRALATRISSIKAQLTELEAKKADAETQLAQVQEKLSQLDQEAETIVAEYIRQGNEARQRILKEAEAAAQKLEEQARRNIDHEFSQARRKLQEDILEQALAKAEGILKGSISAMDQERLVDEYLEKVVA
jgi:F-type H+-transporting ATPase subunit b